MDTKNGPCHCGHHKVIAVLVVLFGLTFLLGTLGVFSGYVVNIIWPILIIVAGGFKLTSHKCKCCNETSR